MTQDELDEAKAGYGTMRASDSELVLDLVEMAEECLKLREVVAALRWELEQSRCLSRALANAVESRPVSRAEFYRSSMPRSGVVADDPA
jgi:hypothetical protein